MSNNSSSVPETLSEIIGVAIEYDLHLEPNQFINYIDLYRMYLLTLRDGANSAVQNTVSFYQFICSQPLLDTAASATEFETGQPIVAPTALTPSDSWQAKRYPLPPGGLH